MTKLLGYAPFLIVVVLSLVSCEPRNELLFTAMQPDETGIDFINHVEENKTLNILSYEYLYNGGGVAAGDFNNDGLQDLFFTGNQVPNKLFINQGDWKFIEIAERANVSGKNGWKTGVTLVDINGDRLLDIYVCYSGPGTDQSRANQLFVNNGGDIPTFTDKTAEFGLDAPGTYSTQASFFDYDLDGDLDMFLLNHAKITYSPFYNTRKLRNKRHRLYGNRLYKNEKGFFEDVSAEAGIHGSAINFGLGISASDVNLDGWPDIYVTNDYEEQDFFYLNNHDGTFKECLKESFRHISRFGMGSDIADYNNDGQPDVFVVDMLPEDSYRQKLLKGPDEYDKYMLLRDSGYHHQNMRNMLQVNLGANAENVPQFSEVGQLAGVSNTDWSWCPLFVDLDNDGWKDLFVTNGYLRDYTNQDFLKYTFEDFKKKAANNSEVFDTMSLIKQMPSTKLQNYCFHNKGNLEFTNTSNSWGFTEKGISNGAVYADLDDDGDQDIVVNNINEKAYVYRNNSSEQFKNRFIKIKLIGAAPNTSAIGAKVFVRTDSILQLQENFPTRGFQSSTPHELIFGLGDNNFIKEVIVQWPDSKFSKFKNVSADTTLIINRAENTFDSVLTNKPGNLFIDETSTLGINFRHKENSFIDYKVQYLLPYQLSSNGPCLAKADVNKDGYDDFYVGGASGQSGELFIYKNNTFEKSISNPWSADYLQEDTDAVFFDADKDNDPDLYVVSGGSEFSHEDGNLLQDRLYINDGKGNFKKSKDILPAEKSNGSCIAYTDVDKDGDLDLFVGGKSLPGYFPLPAYSYLLRNDSRNGNIKFTDITPDFLRKPGMINTAVWFDYNHDGWEDLAVAGDFTPIIIYENDKGTLLNGTKKSTIPNSHGMWSRLVADDIDADGDMDIIAGNAGLNLQFKASPDQPLTIHYHDFNEDGNLDPLVSYTIHSKSSMYASRDEMLEQLPYLKKKFVKYADYAKAELKDIITPEQLNTAKVLKAEVLYSAIIRNEGNDRLLVEPLPVEAQFSKVNGIVIDDFNNDGLKDLLLSGNFYPYRVQLGRNDSGSGLLLSANSSGGFSSLQFQQTGFYAKGDVRSMIKLSHPNGEYFLLGVNDDSLKMFKLNRK
jgi:hypothetical protein